LLNKILKSEAATVSKNLFIKGEFSFFERFRAHCASKFQKMILNISILKLKFKSVFRKAELSCFQNRYKSFKPKTWTNSK
jgi:hypothetical protein